MGKNEVRRDKKVVIGKEGWDCEMEMLFHQNRHVEIHKLNW